MNQFALMGTLSALAVGIFVGVQGIFAARMSMADNAISTGLVILIAGGLLGAFFLTLLYPTGNFTVAPLDMSRIGLSLIGGLAGVVIVTGSAYAFGHVSPAAAVPLIIFGQMALALLADNFGWTGQEPQPIDMRRIGGLVMLAGAIWLLLPKNN
ncbi:DMT family transporter [Cohaesibacter intestini]|uniref:DMT family transporter n=1 Tax=Cohaesibacter intestini TaxID=2211145 RepID=UPI000DEB2CCD|nr:DMT family transporter [Cohaesibacter intestini]